MDFKQNSEGNLSSLKCSYMQGRASQLLDIATKRFDLVNGQITTPGNLVIPATQFCVMVSYYMDHFLPVSECPKDPDDRNKSMWAGINDPLTSYQVVALLLTIERMRHDTWGYGVHLRSQLDDMGFDIQRPEWYALMAQENTYTNSPFNSDATKLMRNNPLAIALYVAEIATMCGAAHNSVASEKEVPAELCKMFEGSVRQNPKDTLEAMMDAFVPHFLQEKGMAALTGFKAYLNNNGFYAGPASACNHGNFEGGLLLHAIDVLYQLVNIIRPQTPAEMGEIVLLAVCHDLSELRAYQKTFKTEPVNGFAFQVKDGKFVLDEQKRKVIDKQRTMMWPDQRPYYMVTKAVWTRDNSRPINEGAMSLHHALGFFKHGLLSDRFKGALANHKRDIVLNNFVNIEMIQNDLCRNLHIADFMASMTGKKVQ